LFLAQLAARLGPDAPARVATAVQLRGNWPEIEEMLRRMGE
jgi:hypothetical protein